jgi:hypothetical protein
MAKYDKQMWAMVGRTIGTEFGKGNVRKANEIFGVSNNIYNTAVEEAVAVQHELNNIAARFEIFWHDVINSTVIPFREFADDIGQPINDKEYQLNSGSAMIDTQINEFKRINYNSCIRAADLHGRTKSAGAALAAGIGAGLNAYGESVNYLDQAEQYASDVNQKIAEIEQAVLFMRTCIHSYDELGCLLDRFADSAITSLVLLEPLVPDFRFDDEYSKETFVRCAEFIKAIGRLSQISPINEAGEISSECLKIVHSIETQMNWR